jgi:hypothetical protein
MKSFRHVGFSATQGWTLDVHIGCGSFANGPHRITRCNPERTERCRESIPRAWRACGIFQPDCTFIEERNYSSLLSRKYRAPVKLLEAGDFERMREEIKTRGKVVVLHVDRNDMEWIGKSQLRHRDERLKEERRELMTLKDAENQMQEESDDNERPAKKVRRVPWLERMGLGDYLLGLSHG